MSRTIKLCTGVLVLVTCLLAGLTTVAFAADTIELQVSPNVLNLESKGECVTLHANIAHSSVSDLTLTVNGHDLVDAITATFADQRGELVIKCDLDDVKGMVAGAEEAEFVLEVLDTDDQTYTVEDTIDVIDRCR